MIDAKRLLADLKRLRRRLDDDLREHHSASPGRAAVQAEWQAARDAGRTADTLETFWTAALDQAAVHWLLAVTFLRFLEDNRLLDRPLLAGAGERGELAAERQRAYFRKHPHHSDAEYLLDALDGAAGLPGLSGLFDRGHNPLFRLPLSGDGAMALLAFLRERGDDGALRHDFTDAAWGTRFLGDLYQDLSEDARKRFALLQTPDFVESWILDRTLDPAIAEFGWDRVRMIDPACGSGHFLLGGFARLLAGWQRHHPEMPPAAQAQRALDGVAGVDLNPFAVEVARFRLLLAALRAAGETRLAAAPDFRIHLAVGDSLLHGRHFGAQGDLGAVGPGFQRVRRHAYAAEDTAELDRLLGRQYHAVVGNPPYITPKDPAMRDAYRGIYASCHMKYGLGAPFTERFFDLAQTGAPDQAAGFVGLIVANSFMKREFGARLIEAVLPQLDLTHVVDCSGAYIPGHGTPTAILFGRNRAPVEGVVRTVRGIRGEPSAPDDPATGLVWSAIVAQADHAVSASEFISTEDTSRAVLAGHPWNMGGGGAADVQAIIEEDRPILTSIASEVGIASVNGDDDAFTFNDRNAAIRTGLYNLQALVIGDKVRDYRISADISAVWPHGPDFEVRALDTMPDVARHLWPARTTISKRKKFGTPMLDRGLSWYEFQELYPSKLRTPLTITFAFVSTHNHFVLDRGNKVFNRSAPVIKLPANATEEDHLGLLGLLNSATGCFWIKQACHSKGGQGVNEGAKAEAWERFIEVTGTRLEYFPLAANPPLDLARALDTQAQRLSANLPAAVCARATPIAAGLAAARAEAEAARTAMVALQEELDWRCYRLYGLLDDAPEHPDPPPLRLGERAFEIAMARRIAAGTLDTAWFTRHRSTPITDLPAHWPVDYRAVVERRLALIEPVPGLPAPQASAIQIIERPEYKRRWAAPAWEDGEREALRTWLLDRLEAPAFWGQPALQSTRDLADLARRDPEFTAVAGLYAGHAAADLDALVAQLVAREAVPFLAALRYSATGQRKRLDWEAAWDLQRQEDAIDAALADERGNRLRSAWAGANPRGAEEAPEDWAARMAAGLPALGLAVDAAMAAEAKRRKLAEVGPIPVPPKYRTPDFLHADFWRLRGGLDVPKERFVSFPGCARDPDGTLPVLWAGHGYPARAAALAAWYVDRREGDNWPAQRLAPLLAGLLELVPWLRQWHNGRDAESGLRMGDYYAEFVEGEARELGLTLADLRAWTPPAPARRGRVRA